MGLSWSSSSFCFLEEDFLDRFFVRTFFFFLADDFFFLAFSSSGVSIPLPYLSREREATDL